MPFNVMLRQLRKEKRLSQRELAEKLGTTVSTVSAYEVGTRTPDINMAIQIANFFDVSTDTLLGVPLKDDIDLKELLREKTGMTYGGKEVSEHDLEVLEGVVRSIMERGGFDE